MFEGSLVGADDLGDLLTTLEEHECWHGSYAEFLSDIRNFVNIDLVEIDFVLVVVGFGELGNLGSDDFARTAPSREAVENNESLGGCFQDGSGEGGFAVERVNTVFLGRSRMSSWSLLLT